jgi:serine/threonine protein phosphatase PrpC
MTWTLATLSEPGSRPVQQDRWGDAEAAGVRCYALADGLGGHGGGELAAHLAIAAMLAGFAADPAAPPNALLEAANHAIVAAQKEHEMQRQMRSTGVVLCIEKNRARWAHVGDSRLYAFAGTAIVAQTKDHSVPQALVDAGELAAEQLRFHEDRNRLVRSLGSDGPCRPTAGELANGEGFLLASDGFWEGVLEAAMLAAWTSTTTAAGWLEQMAAGLAEPADNYTALAIRRAL